MSRKFAGRSADVFAPYADSLSGAQRTRAEIARGLAKSAAGDSLGPKALAVLSRLVGDIDPHVRINAVRSLGTYGPIAKASLIYATRDYDPNVRIAAAQSFVDYLLRTEGPAKFKMFVQRLSRTASGEFHALTP